MDDTPIVPGDVQPPFAELEASRQVLTDAEDDLRNYQLHVEPIHSNAGNLGVGAMPGSVASPTSTSALDQSAYESTVQSESPTVEGQYDTKGSSNYPLEEAERAERQEHIPRQEAPHVA